MDIEERHSQFIKNNLNDLVSEKQAIAKKYKCIFHSILGVSVTVLVILTILSQIAIIISYRKGIDLTENSKQLIFTLNSSIHTVLHFIAALINFLIGCTLKSFVNEYLPRGIVTDGTVVKT